MTGLLLVLIVIALFIGVPLAIIWALNTLFVLHIAYTFWTWLAALIIGSVVSGGASRTAKR